MRIFYDVYSSRLRGEVLLVVADVLTFAAATFHATGAVRTEAEPWDIALLLVWCAFPGALAKIFGRFELPGKVLQFFGGSAAFVFFAAVLILAGWDLLHSVAPREAPPDLAALVIIFFAWGTGFFLFQPRTYRLHDFLLLAIVLLALKAGRPLCEVWLPVFFLGLYLSSAVRHTLHDVLGDGRHSRVNLQNARALTLLATAATLVPLLGAHFVLKGAFDLEGTHAKRARKGRLGVDIVEGDGTASTPLAGAIRSGSPSGEAGRQGGEVNQVRVVGFSYRLGLRDLTMARFDPREVLRVRAVGERPADREWRPSKSSLWKALTFSSFDPTLESWEEETEYRRSPWPSDGRLPRAALPEGDGALLLRHRVALPVFKNLVSPYRTVEYAAEGFAMYRENSTGDIFPSPSVGHGTVYDALVLPLEPGVLPVGAGGTAASDHEEKYLRVPPARELDLDLHALARRVFPAATSEVRDRVLALAAHFLERGFRYSTSALWRSGRSRLRHFLLEEKIGDCSYFATSTALLLRAAGLSTRIAVGFLGAEWDGEKTEAVIRNRQAHAWVEVHVPGRGWFPVDPTAWVPPDPSYVPPPDATEELKRLLGAAGGTAARGIQEGSLPRDLPPSMSAPTPRSSGFSSDAFSDYHSDELAAREYEPQAPGDGPEDEVSSWVQYGGFYLVDEAGRTLRVQASDMPVSLSFLDDDGQQGLLPQPAGENQAEAGPSEEGFRLGQIPRTAVRLALVPLGIAVLWLLVRAWLRPAAKKREKSSEEAAGEDTAAPPALHDGTGADDADLTPRDRILREYAVLQSTLARTRNHRRPHQTPVEHGRWAARGKPELEEAFLDIHKLLYHIVYGGGDVEESHATLAAKRSRKIVKILG